MHTLVDFINPTIAVKQWRLPPTNICAWFSVPYRTVYCKMTKAAPKVDLRFATPHKTKIKKMPSFGCRKIA